MIPRRSENPAGRGSRNLAHASAPSSENSDYDRLVRLALKQERSVSALVRDLLKVRLRDQP